MYGLKTKKDLLDNRAIKAAMAKDCLRVCADSSCKDPLRETHKAVCGCNRGDKMQRSKQRVDPRVWNQELKRVEDHAAYELGKARTPEARVKASRQYSKAARLHYENEFVKVDEDDLLSLINGEDIAQAVNEIDRDEDVLVIDEDDLLDEINRAKRRL